MPAHVRSSRIGPVVFEVGIARGAFGRSDSQLKAFDKPTAVWVLAGRRHVGGHKMEFGAMVYSNAAEHVTSLGRLWPSKQGGEALGCSIGPKPSSRTYFSQIQFLFNRHATRYRAHHLHHRFRARTILFQTHQRRGPSDNTCSWLLSSHRRDVVRGVHVEEAGGFRRKPMYAVGITG